MPRKVAPALADYLRQHPGIHLPKAKELHFFDDETQAWPEPDLNCIAISRLPTPISFGERQRRSASTGIQQQSGSGATTGNSPDCDSAQSDRAGLLTLGNGAPTGNDPLPFALALEQEDERCREALPLQHRVFSYVDRGFYSSQLRRLWRFFGREQVLVLRQEELRLSPRTCLDKIWQHLKIPPGSAITPLTSHKGEYDQTMDPTCREHLREIFWQEIGQLEHLLCWDCSDWLRS